MLGLEQIVAGLARDDETEAVVLTGAGSPFFSMRILDPVVRPNVADGEHLQGQLDRGGEVHGMR